MKPSSVEQSTKLKEIQEANTFLRERYLYLISSISGDKKCSIRMYGDTEVEGSIRAFDLNFENIIIKDLKTPSQQIVQSAILRTSDVKTISF